MARPALPRQLALLLVIAAAAARVAQGAAPLPAGLALAPPSPLPTSRPAPLRLEDIRLPPGFNISLYIDEADFIPARNMALGKADGEATVVYVSTAQQGAVFAVVDRLDGDLRATCLLLSNDSAPTTPNGLAYDRSTGSLYVAGVNAMVRVDGADEAALAGCDPDLLNLTVLASGDPDMPPQAKHANRGLTLGPDGKLYYTVGAPFDSGEECTGAYCSVWRMNTDGSGLERVASGLRNGAAFTWHPRTGDMLTVAMERTGLGDELPDDLLVAINTSNPIDWGWPYCHWVGEGPVALREPGVATAFPDPDLPPPDFVNATYDEQAAACAEQTPRPIQTLGVHVSPLGVAYWALPKESAAKPWPAEYEGTVFVAQHGSFNSTPPVGYRVANVALGPDGRTATNHTVFAEGWLSDENGEFWGRPTGLLRLPDGSMLVADDYANTVYQITYDGSAAAAAPAPSPVASAGWRTGAGAAALAAALAAVALAVL
jgi:glucose/arabinose dehydrogenase